MQLLGLQLLDTCYPWIVDPNTVIIIFFNFFVTSHHYVIAISNWFCPHSLVLAYGMQEMLDCGRITLDSSSYNIWYISIASIHLSHGGLPSKLLKLLPSQYPHWIWIGYSETFNQYHQTIIDPINEEEFNLFHQSLSFLPLTLFLFFFFSQRVSFNST